MIGTPNPRAEDNTSSASSGNDKQLPSSSQSTLSESLTEESDIDIDKNDQTGLNALETRAIQQQRQLTSAKVLYW